MLNEFLKNALIIEDVSCDYGTEFINKNVKKWFEENNIKTFYIKDDSNKLGIINRFHKTLKEKLNKYFIANDSYNWIDIIDQVKKIIIIQEIRVYIILLQKKHQNHL